ncbi:aspartate kinase [Balneicella halophila]|uniref:aspartate kinase n=1 Tax=Balneicella halophila TaxID=1537566 RepID=UPI001A9CAFA1|nr:aspartate kinase [Balneicella halophila]
MKILKFGGKSLSNGQGITNVLSIIRDKIKKDKDIVVVLSARGNATDGLANLLAMAKEGNDYEALFNQFKAYQTLPLKGNYFQEEFILIRNLLKGVKLTGDYTLKIKDLLLAQGEILATKTVATLLNEFGVNAKAVDSRQFLKTDSEFGHASVFQEVSEQNAIECFAEINSGIIPIITGFIASNQQGETTTIGRNGTNYTASLIANFLNANEIESYTHVDGIFTADPSIVDNAKIINQITYSEASQLSNFGASILHSKSIYPLIKKNISLRILNTFNADNEGTLISNEKTPTGIKSISVLDDYAIIDIIGKGLLGKVGTDARIFSRLGALGISFGIISQGSSERGVSFIIPNDVKILARISLLEEFQNEISTHDIQSIKIIDDISVITVVGENIANFSSSIAYLKQNKISILLVNNSISEDNISLVVAKRDAQKAVNVIHSQILCYNNYQYCSHW